MIEYRKTKVALVGGALLAVGDSAREVYAAVAGHEGVPLVTHVEPADEAFFAGRSGLGTTGLDGFLELSQSLDD